MIGLGGIASPIAGSPPTVEEMRRQAIPGPYANYERKIGWLRDGLAGGNYELATHGSLVDILVKLQLEIKRSGDDPPVHLADLDGQITDAIDAWIHDRPDDVSGYLARLRRAAPGEPRSAVIGQIEAKFGDTFPALADTAAELRDLGDAKASTTLVERYLGRHPDDTQAYAALVSDLKDQRAYARAGEVAAAWLERHPEDLNARRQHLVLSHLELPDRDAEEIASSILEGQSGPIDGELCLDFETVGAVTAASTCWKRRVAALEPDDYRPFAGHHLRSLARSLAAAGQIEALAGIGNDAILGWRRVFIEELGKTGRCDALAGLLAGLQAEDDPENRNVFYFRQTRLEAMVSCSLDAAGPEALAMLADSPASAVQNRFQPTHTTHVLCICIQIMLLIQCM
ncbi:MAG: hypothetical protein AAGM22_27035 [Acidobacteriota bacterium]